MELFSESNENVVYVAGFLRIFIIERWGPPGIPIDMVVSTDFLKMAGKLG